MPSVGIRFYQFPLGGGWRTFVFEIGPILPGLFKFAPNNAFGAGAVAAPWDGVARLVALRVLAADVLPAVGAAGGDADGAGPILFEEGRLPTDPFGWEVSLLCPYLVALLDCVPIVALLFADLDSELDRELFEGLFKEIPELTLELEPPRIEVLPLEGLLREIPELTLELDPLRPEVLPLEGLLREIPELTLELDPRRPEVLPLEEPTGGAAMGAIPFGPGELTTLPAVAVVGVRPDEPLGLELSRVLLPGTDPEPVDDVVDDVLPDEFRTLAFRNRLWGGVNVAEVLVVEVFVRVAFRDALLVEELPRTAEGPDWFDPANAAFVLELPIRLPGVGARFCGLTVGSAKVFDEVPGVLFLDPTDDSGVSVFDELDPEEKLAELFVTFDVVERVPVDVPVPDERVGVFDLVLVAPREPLLDIAFLLEFVCFAFPDLDELVCLGPPDEPAAYATLGVSMVANAKTMIKAVLFNIL